MYNDKFYDIQESDCKSRVPVMTFDGFGKSYVPFQDLCELYTEIIGLIRGTIFPELDIPYVSKSSQQSRNKKTGQNVESMAHADRSSQQIKRNKNRYSVNALDEKVDQSSNDEMLQKLTAADFMLLEIGMYLNTHPEDKNALRIHKQLAKETRKMRDNYEESFGPLTARDEVAAKDEWKWIKDPWPWNYEANFKIREV